MPLLTNDIESELSYAYLHAVASKAGLSCTSANRHGDNYTIDAQVDYFAPIPDTYRTDVSLRVQLKATINKGTETATSISYLFRGRNQYDRLRTNAGEPHRILVVMFLPRDSAEWLVCSPDELIVKHTAYWVCLYGANSIDSESTTIRLPKANLLTPENLVQLCHEIGRNNIPNYSA